MLALVKSLTKLWVILVLLIIGITYLISLMFKSEPPPLTNYKVEGVEVAPNTILCVSSMALVDGGCNNKKAIDCERLIKSYETSCFPTDSKQEKEIDQRIREWDKSFLEEK